MATKTYDEYEVDQLVKAKKQSDEYAAGRKAQADEAAKTSDGVYDAAIATAEKNYNAAAKETESGYRKMYDANAVQELVARRNVEEAMANMGLTDSGLNATQQTAISLQRGRNDYETTSQKRSAVDAIMRELDSIRAQYNAEKTAASRDIYAKANADILDFRQNADANARSTAASLYTADQEAEAARYAAEQEAATKQAQMLLDAQKAQSEERMGMLKLGYQYDEELGGYVKMTDNNDDLTVEKQNLIIEYMKQGYGYDDAKKYVDDAFGSSVVSNPGVNENTAAPGVNNDGNKAAVLDSILSPAQAKYSGEVGSHAMHMTYAHYVNSLLQTAIAEGKISKSQAAEIAIEIETKHGVDLGLGK